MAFIGVRISWLMFARNMDFISVALSAFSLATASSCWDCVNAFVCSSSLRACSWVRSSSSLVRRLRARISMLIATMGSSSPSSACSLGPNGRNDAISIAPISVSWETTGHATAWIGAALPRPEEICEICGWQMREGDRPALACAFADETLAKRKVSAMSSLSGEAIAGDAPYLLRVALEQIEVRNTTAEHWHEARNEPLPELGESCRALQFSRQCIGAGFKPALLLHRRRPLFEDVDRTGKFPGFVGRLRERDRHCVVAVRDGLDRLFQRPDRKDDPAERQNAQNSGESKGQRQWRSIGPVGHPRWL